MKLYIAPCRYIFLELEKDAPNQGTVILYAVGGKNDKYHIKNTDIHKYQTNIPYFIALILNKLNPYTFRPYLKKYKIISFFTKYLGY
jgi:hypothetical protein